MPLEKYRSGVIGKNVGPVLACWDFRNKMALTGGLNTTEIYFSQSGGERSKIKVPLGWVSGETTLPGLKADDCLLAVSSHTWPFCVCAEIDR